MIISKLCFGRYSDETLEYMQVVPRWVYTTTASDCQQTGGIGSTCNMTHDRKSCFTMQAAQCEEITNYQAAGIADCTGVSMNDTKTCELVNAYTDNICSDRGFPNVEDKIH